MQRIESAAAIKSNQTTRDQNEENSVMCIVSPWFLFGVEIAREFLKWLVNITSCAQK